MKNTDFDPQMTQICVLFRVWHWSEVPQIRFALSRGFAISGLHLGDFTQGGALTDSHLPWATIVRPFQGFI
jgi:hypothetical protein